MMEVIRGLSWTLWEDDSLWVTAGVTAGSWVVGSLWTWVLSCCRDETGDVDAHFLSEGGCELGDERSL